MAKDFRADQIRFHTILASGTMWPRQTSDTPPNNPGYLDGNGHPYLGMVIMSASDAYDYEGNFNQSGRDMFNQFGHEPWLVFSGVANTTTNGQDGWDRPDVGGGYPKGSAVLFMGDVIISGTLFGKRQVITVDKDVPGDFHVIGDAFVSGGIFAGETKYPDSLTPLEDAFVVQQGDANNPPRISFRKIKWSTRLASSWTDTYKDCFLVFSGAKDGKDGNAASIALFEGDVHISGNITGDGSGFYAPDENLILNNSASWYNQTNTWWGDAATQDGPAFGHATTGTFAYQAAGQSHNHLNPYYIEQDRWSISGSADTNITMHGTARPIPSHWYSDFINSGSLDVRSENPLVASKFGGFRFLVAGDGLHAAAPGGFAATNRSVFTLSGSGDFALDPFKALVFDTRQRTNLAGNDGAPDFLRITHEPALKTDGTFGDGTQNNRLIFSGSENSPAHFEFAGGEVTGSGGIYLPKKQQSLQGFYGQDVGIMFQGTLTPGYPTAGIFYNDSANGHPVAKFEDPNSNVLIITSSDDLKLGAEDDILINASRDIRMYSGPSTGDIDIYCGDKYTVIIDDDYNLNVGDDWNVAAMGGEYNFFTKDGMSYTDRHGDSVTATVRGVFQIKDDIAGVAGYQWKLFASGSDDNSYLSARSTSTDGAFTLKTNDHSGSDAHLTIETDGNLIMTGSGDVSADPEGGGNINLGTTATATRIQVGHTTVANTTEVELNAAEVDINAGTGGFALVSTTTGNWFTTTTSTVESRGDMTIQVGDTSNASLKIDAKDTVDGIEIGKGTGAHLPVGWPTDVPVTIGGETSLVTISNDLQVGTIAHSGSVDVWGNLTVHGDFIKGHVYTASLEDPLLQLNSGSTTANSGGGIAIVSGSRSVFTNAQGNWNFSMVFGRDTTTSRDTFLAGRLDVDDHTGAPAIDLTGATPIDFRGAGYRTAAGMTMTASQVPGASVYTVRAGNTGSAGRLMLHAGTTDGGLNLGPFHISGSYFTFSPGSKIYLDDTVNDVYFRSQQGGTSQRLDLNLKNALRLTGQPNIQFAASDFQIRHGHSSADPTDVLMLKSNAHPLVFSGSDYSFDMYNGQYMWWNEHATDYTRWNISGDQVRLDMGGAMTGFKIVGATKKIFFNSDSKYIKGDGQVSNEDLTYSSAQTATVKTTGYAQSVEIFAADANELLATKNNRGTGAVLIFTSSATGAPDKGYASLGYSTEELDGGMFTGQHEDVTLIFSGSKSQFPSKTTRGTTLFMGDVVFSGSMAVGNYIYHDGQEDASSGAPQTAIRFQDRSVKLIASGTDMLMAEGGGGVILALHLNPDSEPVTTYIGGHNKPILHAYGHDSTNRASFHNTFSTSNPDIDPANGDDVLLFFSGAIGSKYQAGDTDAAVRATALFGGDVYVSGALGAGTVDLSNLTLTDTDPYLRFYDTNTYIKKDGTNLNFYDAALGTVKSLTQLASLSVSDDLFSVTRTALNVPNYGMSTGSFSFDSGFNGYSDNNPRPTNLASNNNTGAGNTDVYFFVSGAVGMKARAPADIANQLNRRSVALFGGDVHISGTLTSNNTSFGASSLDKCYDTNAAGEEEAGGGRRIIADAEKVEIQRTTTNAIASHHLFGVTGSANFGQIKIAPIVDADGFYTYGGVFVTGSAGRLGFGVGGSTATDVAFSVNSNNNIEIGGTGGNSRKLYWDPNENSTFIRYTNTNSANPGPKILHFANRTADGRISFSMGSGGTVTGTNQGTGFEGHVAVSGSILPGYDNEYNLGSPSTRWANLYTGDLHLRNERGDWTIYEERDMLVVVNNITGKRYKMGLTPLEDDE